MSNQVSSLGEKAAELRRAFDRVFAQAPAPASTAVEDFLAIRVGPDGYAVRLAEISGLYADRRVTSLPSAVGELLGITGVRGTIVPVYDLRVLFGYRAQEESRWLIVAAEKAVGLAFDAFDGHLRIPKATAATEQPAEDRRPFIQGVVAMGNVFRPVVHVSSLLEAIKGRAQAAPIQEG